MRELGEGALPAGGGGTHYLGMRISLALGDGMCTKGRPGREGRPSHRSGALLQLRRCQRGIEFMADVCIRLQVIGDSGDGGLLAACTKFKGWVQKAFPAAAP